MGTMGFANLVAPLIGATGKAGGPAKLSGTLGRTHFKPKAKRVIYLFMSGGPSHIRLTTIPSCESIMVRNYLIA